MRRIYHIFLISFFLCSGMAYGKNQPPVGSIPSFDLSASFVFFDNPDKLITAFSVDYQDDDEVVIKNFPEDSVWIYYKLSQATPEDGFLLIKTVREYKYPVAEDAKGKVNIIYNDGFYNEKGFISKKWEKQINGKNVEQRYYLAQFKNFVNKKAAEGIEKFLDFYWGKAKNRHIIRDDLRKYFGFNDYININSRLYSCILIHHFPFNGTSYIPVKVPMAGQNNNLEKVYIEVVEIRGNGFVNKKRYWLKES